MAFIGEIQLFGFGYAPPGWVLCDGTTLEVGRFTQLFSLIGTSYGGNGTTSFQLPNLTGRAACGQGQGAGLTARKTGDSFGSNQVELSEANTPAHSHGLNFFNIQQTTDPVSGQIIDNRANVPAVGYSLAQPNSKIFASGATDAKMQNTIAPLSGGSDAHENRQPFAALDYYIMVQSAAGDGIMPVFS